MELNSNQRSMLLFSILIVIVSMGAGSNQLKDSIDKCDIYDANVETVFFDNEQKALQAKISWEMAQTPDCIVNIRLVPLKSKHCCQHECYQHGVHPNITNVLMPNDPMPLIEDHDECKIEPGCNYTVYVETTDQKIQKIVKYEVPDCVDHICSCKYSHLMPKVTLDGTMDSEHFRINWKLDGSLHDLHNHDIHLDQVVVSVGILNNTLLPWGGHYTGLQDFQQPLLNENGEEQLSGFHSVDLNNVTNNGSYHLSIRAYVNDSRGCSGNATHFTYTVPSKALNAAHANINILLTIMICATTILTLLAVGFAYACRDNWIAKKKPDIYFVPPSMIPLEDNPHYGFLLPPFNQSDDEFFEIPHKSLEIRRNIGRGAFGSVYLAALKHIGGTESTRMVAVKKFKENSTNDDLEEFFDEINMMKTVSPHPNIVSLIGYCTIKKPMLMVMEYVSCGDLLGYLRKFRHRHEVRSVVVSDNNTEKLRILQAGGAHNLAKASNSSYDASGYYKGSNNVNSNDSSTTNLTTSTTIHSVDHNRVPVLKYLDLVHSPMNSSSSGTANSDASYVTRTGSETSKKRDTDEEFTYTVFPQSNGMPTNLPNADYSFDSTELHRFAIQIATGMRHLEELKITHRDLAARNILIDENKQLKISDFGLSRSGIYVNAKNKKVPLRWLAIEALRDQLYSTKSDVWAFGIVLWEIGTLGGMPYPSISNAALLSYLLAGNRMQRPEICSRQLYDLMQKCWSENPDSRPSFEDIVEQLDWNTVQNPIYVDLDELELNYAFPPTVDDVLDKTNFGEFGETGTNVLETASTPISNSVST